MPDEYVWIPAPKNLKLPVSAEMPSGFVENYVWNFVRRLKVASNSKSESPYFCHSKDCNRWTLGEPMETEEYAILSGREGTAYYCCRCGHEISFVSRIS